MKKLIIVGVFVFAFALTANVAFASCGCGFSWCCPETVVNNTNNSAVVNSVSAISGTGKNSVNAAWLGSSSISTGAATSVADVQNQVGYNQTEIAGTMMPKIYVNNTNNSMLWNATKTIANTGSNSINSGISMNTISTGVAASGATVLNVVGSSVTKIGCASCGVSVSQ